MRQGSKTLAGGVTRAQTSATDRHCCGLPTMSSCSCELPTICCFFGPHNDRGFFLVEERLGVFCSVLCMSVDRAGAHVGMTRRRGKRKDLDVLRSTCVSFWARPKMMVWWLDNKTSTVLFFVTYSKSHRYSKAPSTYFSL